MDERAYEAGSENNGCLMWNSYMTPPQPLNPSPDHVHSTNAKNYYFADFTRDNYRRLLRLARANFSFRFFEDFDRQERFVLWRHDIDFSVHSALKLASIEAEEGVGSTYFLHLHSRFYNLLDPENTALVRSILAMGHRIGLHFDIDYWGANDIGKMMMLLRRESKLLEVALGLSVRVFSFHNPSPFALSCNAWSYGGLINAYAEYFQRDLPFVSDSNGYWRFRRLEDVLRGSEPRLQVLTHPGWWPDVAMSPKERVHRCIDGRAEATKRIYDDALRAHGRENVDW